jgi:hypothetical protein
MVGHAKYTQAEKLHKIDAREFDRMLARFIMGCKVTQYRSLGFIKRHGGRQQACLNLCLTHHNLTLGIPRFVRQAFGC